MTYLTIKKFSNGKPIIYGVERIATPFGVVMKEADIQTDFEGRKSVPEGSFIAQIGNSSRFLPRTRVKGTFSSNADGTSVTSNTLTLKTPSFAFKPGDVLYSMSGSAQVMLAGTFAAGDTVTLRINRMNYSVTAPATPTASSVAAALLAANQASFTGAGIRATQVDSMIKLLATEAHEIVAFSSSPSVMVTVNSVDPGYFGDNMVPLGTVAAVGAATASGERVITLISNATSVVPANGIVGVQVDRYLGIYPDPMDFTGEPVKHVAPIKEVDGVYESNLPYCDSALKRIYSDLNINKYFYK